MYGPVPNSPANPYIDSYVRTNPYPFSVSVIMTPEEWYFVK
jgi:hypothetical protein